MDLIVVVVVVVWILFKPLLAGVGSSARLKQPAPQHSRTFRAHTHALARATSDEMNDAIANYRAH